MSFTDAIQTCLKKYADFTGRATRPEYWWFFLFQVIVIVIGFLVHPLLYLLAVLALLLPGLAAGARRMHDTGKSGWFLLIGLIPFVGGIILIVFLAQAGQTAANQWGDPV